VKENAMTDQTKRTPGPLEYVEGDMLTADGPRKACWLVDADENVIAAVAVGKDFDLCKSALEHAAHATQVLPELLAALRLIQNMSIDKEEDAKWTWRDICLECERVARAAIAKATAQPQPLRDDERAEVLKSASSA
jgi:hypothetical protein